MPNYIPAPDSAIFSPEVLDILKEFKSYEPAREFIAEVINTNDKAKPVNIDRARKMLNASRSLVKLQEGCYYFFLAHQGQRVIR